MNKQQIYLEKRLKVLVPLSKANHNNKILVATISKNLESLGYIFSRELFNALSYCHLNVLQAFYAEIVPILKKMRGAHRQFNPMYPNFPSQVMEASDCELYLNAIVHYWSFVLKDVGVLENTWLPHYQKIERLPLSEKVKYDVINLGNLMDFESIFATILSGNTSISESDKEIIVSFVKGFGDKIVSLIPENIPMKENLGVIAAAMLEHTCSAGYLSKCIKTPTDVLRVAVSLSKGDVSLAANCKFASFNRKTRRFLLSLLESANNLEEDMLKYKNVWIKLGERLHPGEFKSQYPKTFVAFRKLRQNEKIETFSSNVENAIAKKQIKSAIKLLKQRPGYFARRLDHIFRVSPDGGEAASQEFIKVAGNIATPVLLQVINHFEHRNLLDYRPIFPKGQLAKIQVLNGKLPELNSKITNTLIKNIKNVLVSRFSNQEKLGKVYLDPKLSQYNVPFSQRSASKALKTIVRGSKIDLDGDYDTIRFFIWWKNMSANDPGAYFNGRVDIDLSADILDENFNSVSHICYYDLRNTYGCHSGDITDAPNGASEFIDISMDKVLESGGRYVVMCINAFTSTPFCNLPECFAGFMGRSMPNSGGIYEPKTVKNKFDVASDANISIPLIIDCLERKVIWVDLALKARPMFSNNIGNNRNNIGLVCKAMVNLKKPNLYDLFALHAKGRGKLVDNIKEADTIFSEDKGITPYDLDKVSAEFLK